MKNSKRNESGKSRESSGSNGGADSAATSRLHNVLVEVCLAVVGGCEGAEPGYGEGMAEHHFQVHPLGLLGPPPLLLLQLLDALREPGGNKQGERRVDRRLVWFSRPSTLLRGSAQR